MRNKNTIIYNIRRPPFPFKNPSQEIYLRLNEPKVFEKFYKEHGHAPGYSEYLKNRKGKKGKKKVQKTSESIKTLLKLAEILDKEQQYVASDKLTKIASRLIESHCGHCGETSPVEASCNACKASTAKAMTCQACGWSEAKMCPECLMKRFGETCPDCGDKLAYAEAYASVKEAKTLTESFQGGPRIDSWEELKYI
jgi:predicted transcriptional regulator